jgi:hypothetical protein
MRAITGAVSRASPRRWAGLRRTATAEVDAIAKELARVVEEAQRASAAVGDVTSDFAKLSQDLDGLRDSSARQWDQALGQVENVRDRSRDVGVANRQVQTAARRAQDDIAAVVGVADKLVRLDADSIDLSSAQRGEPPLLDLVRSQKTLRVGVWHGFRGLNFAHPKTGKGSPRYREIVERWQGRVYSWGKTAHDFL